MIEVLTIGIRERFVRFGCRIRSTYEYIGAGSRDTRFAGFRTVLLHTVRSVERDRGGLTHDEVGGAISAQYILYSYIAPWARCDAPPAARHTHTIS
jgi:hypothetical protein